MNFKPECISIPRLSWGSDLRGIFTLTLKRLETVCALSSFKTYRFVIDLRLQVTKDPLLASEKMTLALMPNTAENHYIHHDIHDLHFKIVFSFGWQ